MKAIIFGINGQDGYYLKNLLISQGLEVIGISRSNSALIGDVSNFSFVKEIIKTHTPDYVFHLAAKSTTSHEALFENHNTISSGTLNILEAVKIYSPVTRVFLSGSAMQFKNEGSPISEKTPFEGSSPYSVARIQSVYLARYYLNTFGIKVFVGYFFNHDSALRAENHVNQKIAAAARRIQNGSTERLLLGNIDVRKEFNFAGDFMEAIWLMVNQDSIYEAIIGSGTAYSIEEWIEYCFTSINRDWRHYVDIQNNYVPEYNILVSDPNLICSLGWNPRVSFSGLGNRMMKNVI